MSIFIRGYGCLDHFLEGELFFRSIELRLIHLSIYL